MTKTERNPVKKNLYLLLGYFSVILGVIGIALPVLPTVPFAILSAFCFSKSSPRLHKKILNLPRIGPIVRDWEEHGVISAKGKWLCTFGIGLFLGSSIFFTERAFIKWTLVATGVVVLVFVLSRPSVEKTGKK